MKNSKALYVAAFSLVAIVFALFEYEILPNHLIPGSPEDPFTAQLTYIIDLISILMAIGGCFVLLYWFRLGFVRKSLEDAAESAIAKHHNIRLIIWLVLMLITIVLYYEASFANNPKYSIFILFVAGVFCWPSMPVIDAEKDEASKVSAAEEPTEELTENAMEVESNNDND